MGWGRRRKPFDWDEEDVACHFDVSLVPKERELLLALLEDGKAPTLPERQYIARKLRDAICRDGPPLPVAKLDWRRAEQAAASRGESLIDWIFDGAPPPPPDKAA